MKIIEGGITTPKGFKAAGVCAGIRGKHSKNDMAMVVCEGGAVTAGMFTKNKVKAAPVVRDARLVGEKKLCRAILINSGIANACTGEEGMANAEECARLAGSSLGFSSDEVLVCSTGVIGMQLEMDIMKKGIEALSKLPKEGRDADIAAATAIMTTDTRKKEICVQTEIDGKTVTVSGMCKGSGMIHPNLGTMLGFITTDAAISVEMLDKAIRTAVPKTFNMVSIDGDTSTNDTVLLLASGCAENEKIESENEDYEKFLEAVTFAATYLAKRIAEDGEGATKLLEVNVKNAVTYDDAVIISKSVACSSLTKSAAFGCDANWGRIICAMGYSGGSFNPDICDISIKSEKGETALVINGTGAGFDEDKATEILSAAEIAINIDLKEGNSSATAWGCDLTYDYVKINADYRS